MGLPRGAVAAPVPLRLHRLDDPGAVIRAATHSLVVSGSGDGLVDAAAAGLLDGDAVVRYSASLDRVDLADAIDDADGVIVTDSNRDRARREATGVHPEDAQTEPVAEAPRRSGSREL